jgi:hypothetical protein
MIVAVHMLAFRDRGTIREVEVSDGFGYSSSVSEILQEVYKMGQNEFQQRDCPSVSCGDVIEFEAGEEKYWQVKACGFKGLTQEEFEELPGHFVNSDRYWELYK